MKVKTIAIIEIVLGALVIATIFCPSPLSRILFGALIMFFGIALLTKRL